MLSELRRDLPQPLQSYGSTQAVLDCKLQRWLLCSEGRATVLNGLSQVFPWLSQKLVGKRVLLPAPTFGEYPPQRIQICEPVRGFIQPTKRRIESIYRNQLSQRFVYMQNRLFFAPDLRPGVQKTRSETSECRVVIHNRTHRMGARKLIGRAIVQNLLIKKTLARLLFMQTAFQI